jgi:single-strand DNA-binding protein
MSDINHVTLIGRLTKNPELKYTQAGKSVASFSIANDKTYVANGEKKQQTSFFNCVSWGKLGETISKYCKKGHRIGIEGRLQQRSWTDQSGQKRYAVEVVAENMQFLQARTDSNDEPKPSDEPQPDKVENAFDNPFDSDNDIPF